MIQTTIVQGTWGIPLNFTLTQEDGKTPWNLTGATVTVIAEGRMKLTRQCFIDSAAEGTCHYTLAQNDDLLPGSYQIQVQVATSSLSVTAIDIGRLTVLP